MTVVAECSTCDDRHVLGDRSTDEETVASTVCPVCGSPSYRTHCDGERVTKSESQRIADAVATVHGVGEETKRNIVEAFDLYAGLDEASIETLTQIDGVGEQTARGIQNATT